MQHLQNIGQYLSGKLKKIGGFFCQPIYWPTISPDKYHACDKN